MGRERNRRRWTTGAGLAAIACIAGGIALTCPARAAEGPLAARCSEAFLREHLVPRDAWMPFPPAADRGAWEALLRHPINRARRAYLVERAEALLGAPWPALPATLYMEFARSGDRARYERPYFARRENLATLVLAECMEHRGRFLDGIADGIWAICEETTWCLPAHAARARGAALHRLDRETLDLFACETGMLLAQTHALLRKELDGVCPMLCARIRREVKRRILDAFLAQLAAGRPPGWTSGFNNWAPWCASNVLGAALYLEEDPARLADIAHPLIEVVDRFIARYGEDGGCNEGPSYWNVAGGAMLIFLEHIHGRTRGSVAIYDIPKIAAMGRYIAHAHIDGPWFANFADADPNVAPQPGMVYRFGERVGSEALRNLALLSMRRWRTDGPVDPPLRISGAVGPIQGPLMDLFWIPPDARPREIPRPLTAWLPDLQVLFARESIRAGRGLVLAAKGGHNAESHNHNDVGHFMVYLDGRPGIIDLGREAYTRQTFGPRRYELLFTRGLGHNAPVVGGVEQRAGSRYRATHVACRGTEDGVILSMHLEAAYPAEAGLAALERTFEVRRGSDAGIIVRDAFRLKEGPARILVPMFAARPVERSGPGRLAIASGPRHLLLEYEPPAMKVAIEEVPVEDAHLRAGWGERIHRIAFEFESSGSEGVYAFRFRAGE